MEKSVEAGTRGGVANGNPLRAGAWVTEFGMRPRKSCTAQEDSKVSRYW